MKFDKKEQHTVPNYFKKIGIVLAVMTLVTSICFKYLHLHVGNSSEILRSILYISLLVIIVARDKVEDELTLKLKLRAFAFAFLFGVGIVIVTPFVNLLFGESFISDSDVHHVVFSMIFMYFIQYYLLKRDR